MPVYSHRSVCVCISMHIHFMCNTFSVLKFGINGTLYYVVLYTFLCVSQYKFSRFTCFVTFNTMTLVVKLYNYTVVYWFILLHEDVYVFFENFSRIGLTPVSLPLRCAQTWGWESGICLQWLIDTVRILSVKFAAYLLMNKIQVMCC